MTVTMPRRHCPAEDETDLQLAALLWLLSRQRSVRSSASLMQMTLDHFDLVAGNPQIAGVVRVACARLAQQWRSAARAGQLTAEPARGRATH